VYGVLLLVLGILIGWRLLPRVLSSPAAVQVAAISQQLQQKDAELQQLRERLKIASAQPLVSPPAAQAPESVVKTTETPVLAPPLPAAKASEPVSKPAETPVPQPPTGKTFKNSIGMEFVLIPAGTFQMGSKDANAYDDQKLVHQVTISKPFYLGKYEVTQAQWQAVMVDKPSNFKGETLPVANVSWGQVQEFIRKLNAREQGTKYRLPTEAEWEYAARAGTTTAYSFGDDERQLAEYAWYSANAGNMAHAVGQKKPNPWGLYDMHGNVWEWVQDWYGPYTAGNAVDPAGPPSGSHRVGRGGSWYCGARHCRSADRRHCYAPGARYAYSGFRLLREVQ
jgi:formylglycine-generating enzyme required for sulfatase activity